MFKNVATKNRGAKTRNMKNSSAQLENAENMNQLIIQLLGYNDGCLRIQGRLFFDTFQVYGKKGLKVSQLGHFVSEPLPLRREIMANICADISPSRRVHPPAAEKMCTSCQVRKVLPGASGRDDRQCQGVNWVYQGWYHSGEDILRAGHTHSQDIRLIKTNSVTFFRLRSPSHGRALVLFNEESFKASLVVGILEGE